MKSTFILIIGYLITLPAALALPGYVIMKRSPMNWDDMTAYGISGLMMIISTVLFCLIIARITFPKYWWMGQVEGKDVFEFEGIYFLGLRITRVPSRLQRMLFGIDERNRRWDMIFGLLFIVMVVPHMQGLITMNRYLDRTLPNPPRITQTLHHEILSTLPIMKRWEEKWSMEEDFIKRVDRELQLLKMQPRKTNSQRFDLAQLYLLSAFEQRKRAGEPFYHSPGEQVFFNRSMGAQAVAYLNQLLQQPEADRVGWSGGAHTLIGFFHLSEENYAKALEEMEIALSEIGEGDKTEITRYQVLLIMGQGAILAGKGEEAIKKLDLILLNENLPRHAYALALEQYVEALRQLGTTDKIEELLDKAQALYEAQNNQGGIARIHLHRAALAIDKKDFDTASRELSQASQMASQLGDGFTLNMVEKLSLAISG